MIHLSYTPNVFDPTTTERWSEPWRIDGTIETCIPARVAEKLRPDHSLVARRNGITIPAEDWDGHIVDGDCIDLFEEPRTGLEATFAIPFVTSFTVTGAAAVGVIVGTAAAGLLAARFAIQALTPSIHKPKKPDEKAGTYGFGGIAANRDTEGAALPVVYGEHRVAGPLVAVWSRSNPNVSELYMLMAVAGHEVERIGDKTADGEFAVEEFDLPTGLLINNQPAENFDDVDVFVRMGTATQSPIPDFDIPILQFEVGQTLLPPDDSATTEITPGVYTAGALPSSWTTEVSYTMGEAADEFIAEVAFTGGLFQVNSTGDQVSDTVTFQGRYRRVDSNGVQFGDYVVLPKWGAVTAAQQRPFAVELSSTFIDPADFAVPTAGEFMQLDGVNDHLTKTSPTGISSMTAASTEITVMGWIRLDLTVASGAGSYTNPYVISAPGTTKQYVFTQFAASKGFEFYVEVVSGVTHQYIEENGNRVNMPAFRMGARLGDGTTVETFQANHKSHGGRNFSRDLMPASVTATGATTGRWALVAMTYKASDPDEDGDNSVRFIFYGTTSSGQPHTTRTTTVGHLWNQTAAIFVGSQDAAGGYVAGDLDDVLIYQRAVSQIEIAAKWNGGNGIAGIASEANIVGGWHMDSATTTTADFVGTNDLTLTGGPTVSSGGGPVAGSASGTRLRDRYVIEIQRLTDPPASKFGQNEARWQNTKTLLYSRQNFAGTALVAARIRWDDQLSGGRPNISIPVRGAKVPVWDGIDEVHPNLPATWSRNAAWQIVDAALNDTYGLGADIDSSNIDLPAFREAAAYFDEAVKDGRDPRPSIQFAQFTTDPDYPNGYYHFDVADADWPSKYPPALNDAGVVFADGESGEFFAATSVDAAAPAWVKAIEDVPLSVGEILHIKAAPERWEVRCHAPAGHAPTATSTYTPASSAVDLVKHYETRTTFNGVFDEPGADAWTALQTIATAADASLAFAGEKLTIYVDRARPVSAMVTDANVVPGSLKMSWLSRRDRANVIEATYLDESESFEGRTVIMEHGDLTDPTNSAPRIVRRMQLRGVTRISQARRVIRKQLNVFATSRRTIEFKVGPDSLGYLPGDVVAFSHGLPAWGVSGRVYTDSPDRSPSELFLDRDTTIESGKSYEISVRSSRTGSIETVAVDEATTGGAATYSAGSRITMEAAFLNRPERGDLFSFGEVAKTRKLFKVISSKFNTKTFERTVTAAEYSSTVYDEESFSSALSSVTALPAPTTGTI